MEKRKTYGGVVCDEFGYMLLREPKDHFGGYVWTFPKGVPRSGESPQQTALRKVLEETGVEASIDEPVPVFGHLSVLRQLGYLPADMRAIHRG